MEQSRLFQLALEGLRATYTDLMERAEQVRREMEEVEKSLGIGQAFPINSDFHEVINLMKETEVLPEGNDLNKQNTVRRGRPKGLKNKKRRKFSAAARKKMSEAQLLRRANERKAEELSTPVKKKRRMSAATRKAMSEAAKQRWAAYKATEVQVKKK